MNKDNIDIPECSVWPPSIRNRQLASIKSKRKTHQSPSKLIITGIVVGFLLPWLLFPISICVPAFMLMFINRLNVLTGPLQFPIHYGLFIIMELMLLGLLLRCNTYLATAYFITVVISSGVAIYIEMLIVSAFGGPG